MQTPTTPTPCSTPGLSPRRCSRFNPHLAHLAGFNFRKESCGSCQKNLNRQGRAEVPAGRKDLRYFCKNCRMLHRYDDPVGRSCTSLADDFRGSTSSVLDKKAFYYTPTHIHLAIISANARKKKKAELLALNSEHFSSGALHDTKSESNITRSEYTSNTNLTGSQDIFSPNPRRKISDICAHSLDTHNEFPMPYSSSVQTIYSKNMARNAGYSIRDLQQSFSSEQDYNASQYDLRSQTSLDLSAGSCLQIHRGSSTTLDRRDCRLGSCSSDSKPNFYLHDSDALTPSKLLSKISQLGCPSSQNHGGPHSQGGRSIPRSPRLLEHPSESDDPVTHSYSRTTSQLSVTPHSSFSYDGTSVSEDTNSAASSITSQDHSSSRSHLPSAWGGRMITNSSCPSLPSGSSSSVQQHSGAAYNTQQQSAMWFSSVSTDECGESPDDDDDDEDELVTVTERSRSRAALCETRALNKSRDSITINRDTLSKSRESIFKNRDTLNKSRDSIFNNRDTLSKSRESINRNRDTLSKSRESICRNRDTLNKSRESLNRNRDTLNKSRESIFKNRQTLNRSRESLNRNRDALDKSRESIHLVRSAQNISIERN